MSGDVRPSAQVFPRNLPLGPPGMTSQEWSTYEHFGSICSIVCRYVLQRARHKSLVVSLAFLVFLLAFLLSWLSLN